MSEICQICQKPFKNKGGLTRHLRKDHPEEYEVIMEKELNAKYESNLKEFSGIYNENFIKSRIFKGKYELYLLHNRIDDAIEQLKQEILLYLKYFENLPSEYFLTNLDPFSDAQNVMHNCLTGFLITLNNKYKDNIPMSILMIASILVANSSILLRSPILSTIIIVPM